MRTPQTGPIYQTLCAFSGGIFGDENGVVPLYNLFLPTFMSASKSKQVDLSHVPMFQLRNQVRDWGGKI